MTRQKCKGPYRDSDYSCCPFTSFAHGPVPAHVSECEYHTPHSNCEFYGEILKERQRRASAKKPKHGIFGRLFG